MRELNISAGFHVAFFQLRCDCVADHVFNHFRSSRSQSCCVYDSRIMLDSVTFSESITSGDDSRLLAVPSELHSSGDAMYLLSPVCIREGAVAVSMHVCTCPRCYCRKRMTSRMRTQIQVMVLLGPRPKVLINIHLIQDQP